MRCLISTLLPLLLLIACRRPEVEAFGKHPTPIVVSIMISPGYTRSEAVKSEYAAALRAKLATCVTVVPAEATAPESAADLRVTVTRIRPYADPSPAVIGTATGVAVGTLSALAGNRDPFFDGLFWGLWAGSAAADSQDWNHDRLGYNPLRVSAEIKLEQRGIRNPLLEFSLDGRDVINAMQPLSPDDRHDETRIREEEAKAFARVVVSRLQEQFHWLPLAAPSYYKPTETPPPAVEQVPAPPPDKPVESQPATVTP